MVVNRPSRRTAVSSSSVPSSGLPSPARTMTLLDDLRAWRRCRPGRRNPDCAARRSDLGAWMENCENGARRSRNPASLTRTTEGGNTSASAVMMAAGWSGPSVASAKVLAARNVPRDGPVAVGRRVRRAVDGCRQRLARLRPDRVGAPDAGRGELRNDPLRYRHASTASQVEDGEDTPQAGSARVRADGPCRATPGWPHLPGTPRTRRRRRPAR